MMHRIARCRGFSLIEMLMCLALLAVLAVMVVPVTQTAVQRKTEHELRRALHDIRRALDDYKRASDDGRIPSSLDSSGYPRTLEILEEGVIDQKDPARRKIYFLRRVPRDPLNTDPSVPAAMTWGKRSYASDADDPREGVDIYDVYSLHPGLGLNDVPYRKW